MASHQLYNEKTRFEDLLYNKHFSSVSYLYIKITLTGCFHKTSRQLAKYLRLITEDQFNENKQLKLSVFKECSLERVWSKRS